MGHNLLKDMQMMRKCKILHDPWNSFYRPAKELDQRLLNFGHPGGATHENHLGYLRLENKKEESKHTLLTG